MQTAQNNQSADVGQVPPVAEPASNSTPPAQTPNNDPDLSAIDSNLQAAIDNLSKNISPTEASPISDNSDAPVTITASSIPDTLTEPLNTINPDETPVAPDSGVEIPQTQVLPVAANSPDETDSSQGFTEAVPEFSNLIPEEKPVVAVSPTRPTSPTSPTNPSPTVADESSTIPDPAANPIPDPISTPIPDPISDPITADHITPTPDPMATSTPSPGGFSFSVTNSFFDNLVNNGTISPKVAEELRQENLSSGKSYEELLLAKQLATEAEITQAKAEYNKLPYIKLSATGVDPEALNLIDEVIAKRYQVLPFNINKDEKKLQVAMANPLDLGAIDFLRQKTGYSIEAHYSEPGEITRMISERYAQSLSNEVTEALKTTNQYQNQQQDGVEIDKKSDEVLRDAPINRIVENILDFAIKSRASDVHIEPQPNRTRVRYRIDGILVEKLILPRNVHDAVISRIKIMANLKIDEKRVPQDGRFNYKANAIEIDLRISSLPTVHGEKIVMRLLQKNMAVPSLDDLGMSGLGLQRVKEAIKVPHGIVLITGPTGSGKTTTLYSILHMINKVGVNIMTLEDPVEYQIPGVSQVQTNPKAGLTFASGLRSFLRQDPDIIMVGEIRDNETADLALQASLTGHLVFSTLHTNSASGALPRLLDMEAEPFLLASSMTLAMGQRVVRRINSKYKEEYQPEAVVIEDIKKVLGPHFDRWCKDRGKDPNKITLFRPKEDRPSEEPDYKGRVGIYEVMPISPEIASLILNRQPASEIEKMAMQQGMTLMKQDGYLKALDGITTIEEVLRVAEVTS